jgi:hypothetical protein
MKQKTPHAGAQRLREKQRKNNRPIMGRFAVSGAAARRVAGDSIGGGCYRTGAKESRPARSRAALFMYIVVCIWNNTGGRYVKHNARRVCCNNKSVFRKTAQTAPRPVYSIQNGKCLAYRNKLLPGYNLIRGYRVNISLFYASAIFIFANSRISAVNVSGVLAYFSSHFGK